MVLSQNSCAETVQKSPLLPLFGKGGIFSMRPFPLFEKEGPGEILGQVCRTETILIQLRVGIKRAMRLLESVRVLDLTNVLAGPFCCYQLAQLGADVIKVEVPGSGDLARQLGADPELNHRGMGASFLAQNAGKRSITLNLKSAKGRDAFARLLATSDVVVENFRPGVMARLGLGYAALKAVKDDIIYCAISGFGQDGPLRFNPAHGQV